MQASPIPEAPHRRRRLSGGVPFIGLLLVGCLPGPLKRLYYRMRGAKIGANVSLGIFSYIQSPEIVLADDVDIAPFTFIRTHDYCRIGARSKVHAFTAIDTGKFSMGEDSAILEQVTVGGMMTPRSALHIGSRVKIFPYSFLNPTEPITIGDDVGIGGGNYIFTHGSWQSMLDGFPASFGPVTLERGVWLPWRVFVMPNVTIGEYATIGAGSVVTRDIPARSLAIGSPARVAKTGDEYIQNLTPDEKHARVVAWLRAFAEYLDYAGKPTAIEEGAGGLALTITQPNNARTRLVFVRAYAPDAASSAAIVITLDGLDARTRSELARKKVGWFDLAARECGLSRGPSWNETREFLSRYGVKFAVVGEV